MTPPNNNHINDELSLPSRILQQVKLLKAELDDNNSNCLLDCDSNLIIELEEEIQYIRRKYNSNGSIENTRRRSLEGIDEMSSSDIIGRRSWVSSSNKRHSCTRRITPETAPVSPPTPPDANIVNINHTTNNNNGPINFINKSVQRFRKTYTENPVAKAAREAFHLIDANGDGYLQRHEVIEAISTIIIKNDERGDNEGSYAVASPRTVDTTNLCFGTQKFNSIEEVHHFAKSMADNMINEVDANGDGKIDLDEFLHMMQKSQSTNASSLIFQGDNRMSLLAKNILLAHQRKKENNVVGSDFWLITPLDWRHAAWDVFISILIMITVVTMPLTLGWDEFNNQFYTFNFAVDMIFLLDICKNFCTGFIDENDAIILDAKIVKWNYIKGFFLTDLASSIPIDVILKSAGLEASDSVSSTKQSLKMLKLIRLTKLFRLLRLSRIFRYVKIAFMWLEETFSLRIPDGFMKLIRLGAGTIFLGHWIGCFNFMLVRLNDFPSDSWVVYAGLEGTSPSNQWSWSFFKALAQMIMIGFETPPFTNASCDSASEWCAIEYWITLACLYLGAIFYSLLISSISSILQTANLASRQFEEKLIQLDDYMRSKKLPAPLRERVKDYFHLQHSDGKLFNEGEILNMVTPILRREIKQHNGKGIIAKVPFLASIINRPFADELATCIEETIAFIDEILIRQDTTGDEMYFISSGVVEIYLESNKNIPYVTIGDGCYFGDVALLLGTRRTASAKTRTQCILYKISRKNLLLVLNEFPEAKVMMQTVAEKRRLRLEHHLHPDEYGPLDPGDEVDTEDSKTVLFGMDVNDASYAKEEAFENNRRMARIRKRQTHISNNKPFKNQIRNAVQNSTRRVSIGRKDSPVLMA